VPLGAAFGTLTGLAGLKLHRGGTGDIPLALAGTDRVSYLALWPHARSWRLRKRILRAAHLLLHGWLRHLEARPMTTMTVATDRFPDRWCWALQ
jgi:hypothetical protein